MLNDSTSHLPPLTDTQEFEKATGKVSSNSKEAFRAALVRTMMGWVVGWAVARSTPTIIGAAAATFRTPFNRPATQPTAPPQTNLLERRLFYIPSFKIYGSVAGFYDYGPPGCAIKQNLTQAWRQHFVLEENMLEVGCCLHSMTESRRLVSRDAVTLGASSW